MSQFSPVKLDGQKYPIIKVTGERRGYGDAAVGRTNVLDPIRDFNMRRSNVVNLDHATSLVAYLESHMKNSDTFNSNHHILSNADLTFPLCGRDEALLEVADRMKRLSKPYEKSMRTDRAIVVCSGLQGIGKSRMLEEWKTIFDLANGPKQQRLGIILPSWNDSYPAEDSLNIEAAFSWRLLHLCFVAGNGKRLRDWLSRCLPDNFKELTLQMALAAIREKAGSVGLVDESATLHIFLGVDRYHSLRKFNGKATVGDINPLQRFLNLIGEIIASPVEGTLIYPMLAGHDVACIPMDNNLKVECVQLRLNPLSQPEMESAIEALPYGSRLLLDNHVRWHLFALGGISKWIVEYIVRVVDAMKGFLEDAKPRLEVTKLAFEQTRQQCMNRWEVALKSTDLIRLVAFAISGVSVATMDVHILGMPWLELQDRLLCWLNNANQVLIPYFLLHLLAEYNSNDFISDAEKEFVTAVKSFTDDVDSFLFMETPQVKEPWVLWELFGAYHHAMRIDALMIVGQTIVSVKELFKGALIYGCAYDVVLRPMHVVKSPERQSPSKRACNYTSHNWLHKGLVVINEADGHIIFALKKPAGGYVVFTDQRKVAPAWLSPTETEKSLNEAREISRTVPADCSQVSCLFSSFHGADFLPINVPNDSTMVTNRQSQRYYGALSWHPAIAYIVRINKHPTTYLRTVIVGTIAKKRMVAHLIMSRRATKAFVSFSELETFLFDQHQGAALTQDARSRVAFW